jgi:hypothetical protein
MTNEEMLKQDLERAIKELEIDGSNTKQKVKYLLEECLEVYFKPKKYLTYEDIMKLETKSYKVLLNGSEYEMKLNQYDYGKEICFSKNGKIVLYRLLFDRITPYINDLHLELVEE